MKNIIQILTVISLLINSNNLKILERSKPITLNFSGLANFSQFNNLSDLKYNQIQTIQKKRHQKLIDKITDSSIQKNSDNSHKISRQLKSKITEVYRLYDVYPQDWAYKALENLSNRYGCLSGYPDGLYRGSLPLTRYEFAAALKACLNNIERLIVQAVAVHQDDLTILARLQQDFETELANLETEVYSLEEQITVLEQQQFSTTTQLNGQVIFAVNAGGFKGDRIIDPKGVELADEDPQATFLFRVGFDFDTSFQGTDLLKVRVDTGSNGSIDNATGLLEPNFGSILDFSQ